MFDKKDSDNGEIVFRHYGVSARQRAINRGIKRLVNKNQSPDLSKYNSLADYIIKKERLGDGYSS